MMGGNVICVAVYQIFFKYFKNKTNQPVTVNQSLACMQLQLHTFKNAQSKSIRLQWNYVTFNLGKTD